MDTYLDNDVITQLRSLAKETGDPKFFSDLAKTFFKSSESGIQKLKDYLSDADASQMTKVAHSLKSSSANLGAMKMFRICEQIEKNSKHGDLVQSQVLMKSLEREFSRTRAALTCEIKSAF